MSDHADHEIKELLTVYRAPALPADFANQLLDKVTQAAPVRPRRRYAPWIAAAASLAAAAAIVPLLFSSISKTPHSSVENDPTSAPVPPVAEGYAAHAPPPSPGARGVAGPGAGGALQDVDRIARATIIVRARLESIVEDRVTYTVLRVVHGMTDAATIEEDVPGPKHWLEPQVGREMLLYLEPIGQGPGARHRIFSSKYDTPDRPLDDTERRILDFLRNGGSGDRPLRR